MNVVIVTSVALKAISEYRRCTTMPDSPEDQRIEAKQILHLQWPNAPSKMHFPVVRTAAPAPSALHMLPVRTPRRRVSRISFSSVSRRDL